MESHTADIWQPVLHHINRNHILHKAYKAALANQFPIAVWRCPQTPVTQAMIGLGGPPARVEINFQAMSTGFCFAPFDSDHSSTYLIHGDFYLRDGESWLTHSHTGNAALVRENKHKLELAIESQAGDSAAVTPWYVKPDATSRGKSPSKAEYCRLVEKAIAAISDGKLTKVVLSRMQQIELSHKFQPLNLFERLSEAYPNAFVSLVALPGVGTWLGATPELLLSLKNNELTTVALAGTRPVVSMDSGWSRTWHEKEIVEQAIVREFIRDGFESHGIRNYVEHPTKSVRIGNLLHLQTKFKLPNLSRCPVNTAEALLKTVHPTPAVCGVPKQEALEFIRKEEFHDRAFYAGFQGPVNFQNQSELYVNLRCMQMLESSALVYAGGGITIDSRPEQEWLETELKLEALLKFINGQLANSAINSQAEAI